MARRVVAYIMALDPELFQTFPDPTLQLLENSEKLWNVHSFEPKLWKKFPKPKKSRFFFSVKTAPLFHFPLYSREDNSTPRRDIHKVMDAS